MLIATKLLANGPMIGETALDFVTIHKLRCTEALERDLRHTAHEKLDSEDYHLWTCRYEKGYIEDIRPKYGYTINTIQKILKPNSMNWIKKHILEKKQNQIPKIKAIEATDLVFELRDGKLISPISGDDMSLSQSVPIPLSGRITAESDEYQSDDTHPAELQLLGAPDRKIQQSKPSMRTKSELGLVT